MSNFQTTNLRGGEQRYNLSAIGYMLIAALSISFIPVLIALADGSRSPFLFNAGWRLGVALGCLFFLLAFYWRLLCNRAILSLVMKRTASWAILLAIVGNCEYVFFTWSGQFVDISVTTVLYEIWPLLLIALTAWLYRHEGRYGKVSFGTFVLVIPALIGITLVAMSQIGRFADVFGYSADIWSTMLGVLLALVAALLAPLMAFGFKWSSDLGSMLSINTGIPKYTIEMFCAIVAFFISSSGASVVNVTVGVVRGEAISIQTLIIAIAGGAFANAIAGIAWRKANFTTNRLDVNAIAYSAPILSLLWLFIFIGIDIAIPSYLVIGAIAIVTSNLLINFEAETRYGFKALILALGTCGAAVYLRDDVFAAIDIIDKWHWTASGYFQAIALSATVFTLLLAFRVARLVSRTNGEESRTFSVFRKLDLLAQRNVISGDIRDCILRMDAQRNPLALKDAYMEARNYIAGICPLNDVDQQMLSEAQADLDALARSKQTGLVLGELFSLLVFAGITVALALLSLPAFENSTIDRGWTRLLVDLFAMLISAVIIFLTANVWDLQRERKVSKLEYRPQYRDYVIRFPDTERRLADIAVSVIVGVVIIITYAGLLAHKWLG